LTVLIQGHADSRGSNAYNLALSEKRAKSVASAIAGYGVEAERIETKGYGETVPVETNDTLEGRHANRRIEAVALTDEGGRVKFQKPE
jgi:outer membrane protein OmpA-like peptidoglycan-associated protein